MASFGSVQFSRPSLGRSGTKRAASLHSKRSGSEPRNQSKPSYRICEIWPPSENELQGDAEILLGNSTALRQSLQQTKLPMRKAGQLPQVHIDEWTILPRAYAAVASYLQAVGYEFDEQTFEQYFTAMQETVAFEMRELWQLRAFAKMVLLESLAALAHRLDATKKCTQPADSLEAPASLFRLAKPVYVDREYAAH